MKYNKLILAVGVILSLAFGAMASSYDFTVQRDSFLKSIEGLSKDELRNKLNEIDSEIKDARSSLTRYPNMDVSRLSDYIGRKSIVEKQLE